MGQPWAGKPPAGKYRVVTYVAADPAALRQVKATTLSNHALDGPKLAASREERIRVPLSMLGEPVKRTLEGYTRLHIRWAQPDAYDALDPVATRTSPGLHVFATEKEDADVGGNVCDMVNRLFGADVCKGQGSFITISADKLQTGNVSPHQFYNPLQQLGAVEPTLAEAICGPETDDLCRQMIDTLHETASFDVSWDHSESSLYLSATNPLQLRHVKEQAHDDYSTQVSVLHSPDEVPAKYAHQVHLSGHVYDLDTARIEERSLVLDTRHRRDEGMFAANLVDPAGLHPALQLSLETQKPPAGVDGCRMYAYVALPRNIFADRYQLQDGLFLASKNLAALNFSSDPVDLEAPEYAVTNWGSAILLELAPRWKADVRDLPWRAQIPLHLRYMAPESGGYQRFDLPYPAVFWACEVPALKAGSDASARLLASPWDATNLGYDALFSGDTAFWHLTPAPMHGVGLYNTIIVPVADGDRTAWVGAGTALAVLLGTLWVLWALFSVMFSSQEGTIGEAAKVGLRDEKKELAQSDGRGAAVGGTSSVLATGDGAEPLRRSKRTATRKAVD